MGVVQDEGRCNLCHAFADTTTRPTRFTDDTFHNIGVLIVRHRVVPLVRQVEQDIARGDTVAIDQAAIGTPMSALGRFLITRADSDIASFKTPDLRNVMATAPYFHDGSAATLWDVMDHYNKGAGTRDPYLSTEIQPLALHETEIDDLVALMASLTSPSYRELGARELARQRRLSRTSRPQRDSVRAFGPKARSAQAASFLSDDQRLFHSEGGRAKYKAISALSTKHHSASMNATPTSNA